MRTTGGRRCPVYPRVCGGTILYLQAGQPYYGLSPRVRGNPVNFARHIDGLRSIPACAGEPAAGGGSDQRDGVYPRVCGGTPDVVEGVRRGDGLSPRVRGNPAEGGRRRAGPGSIPACAGEPPRRRYSRPHAPVYPRVCGGTANRRRDDDDTMGLSPRVRGNLVGARRAVKALRSIPACAGEPDGTYHLQRRHQVYPRVCGGTSPSSTVRLSTSGLSPRVRGNHIESLPELSWVRSIPACAGEPGDTVAQLKPFQVYPRVCGGTNS